MKKFLCVSFAAALFCLSSSAQEKNPDTLLHKIVAALKNNDSSSFVKLFIDYDQLKNLLIESTLKSTNSADKAMALQGVSQYSEEQYKKDITMMLEKRFRMFMNRVNSKGIDPAKLNFVSCQYEVQTPKGFNDQREFIGTIFLKDDKEDYKIPFTATWLETQRTWFGMYLRDILKKDEKEIFPVGDTTVVDVILEKIEEVDSFPPPPPTPKKKTTAKSPQRKYND